MRPQPPRRGTQCVSFQLLLWIDAGRCARRRTEIDVALTRGCCAQPAPKSSERSAEWPKRSPELGGEELRLFPGREVSAPVGLVEIDQVAIGAPGPRLGGSVDLVRKDRDRHRK